MKDCTQEEIGAMSKEDKLIMDEANVFVTDMVMKAHELLRARGMLLLSYDYDLDCQQINCEVYVLKLKKAVVQRLHVAAAELN